MKTFLTLFSLLCMLFISCSKEEVDALTYQVRIETSGSSYSITATGDLSKQVYLTKSLSGTHTNTITSLKTDELNIKVDVLKDSATVKIYSSNKMMVNEKRFKGIASYHIQEQP